jgi:hypothetical protein
LPVWRLVDSHTWCHPRCYICPCLKKWAHCMQKMMVCPYIESIITSWSLHDPKGPSFIVNVVVINSTHEIMASNVITWPTNAVAKFSAIAKIHKYRGFHEGHHFFFMAMEVHGAPNNDMNHFIKECARLFHHRWSRNHLSLSFCIQFFSQCVSITFQCALASIVDRKIMLTGDACSKPPITIRFHDLHASDIKGAMGEITSYHEGTSFFLFFLVFVGWLSFGLSLAFPFCLPCDGSCHWSFIRLFILWTI